MTDLLLPIVVGVIAVLIALGAQRAWERQREGPGRPNLRIAGLGSWWAEKVRVVRMMRGEARATSAKGEPPLADAPPLAVAGRAVRAAGGRRRGPAGPSVGSAIGRVGHAPSGPATSETAGASSTRRHAPHAPASADRESPKPARRPRGHSTIAVDPLEVPLDAHHARVAVGALIDGLEVGKIGRLR